jgi:multiple sugar transport system substrate-binding protein
MNGDELVALPFTNANNVLYYNTDIFEEAGIPTPLELQEQGNWTWESLAETSKQLVDSGAAEYGFYFTNGLYTPGWHNMIEVYAPYGARPWSNDGTVCLFNSPETIEATQFVWDMVYVDKSHPEPSVAADFAAGNVGMTLARQNYVGRLADVPFGWEVTVAPDGPEGYVPSLTQNGIVAWADGDNPDQAAQFVVHTLKTENAAIFSINTPSVRRSLQNIETLSQYPTGFTDVQLERAVLPSLTADKFELSYYHPQFAAIDREAKVIFDGQVWIPDANIPEAMDAVCANIDPLLAP